MSGGIEEIKGVFPPIPTPHACRPLPNNAPQSRHRSTEPLGCLSTSVPTPPLLPHLGNPGGVISHSRSKLSIPAPRDT